MGEFWLYIEKRETQYRVVLSEQGNIIDDIITSECFYSLSPEKLSEWCKNAIDERYEKEMKEIRMMEEVNKWDGAVDQVSRRDKKLGDIGV
jgi:glycine cleavage system aminomethyltransferase T